MEQFEKRCCEVVQTADQLLNRYPKLRRRPGSSLAGRILYPCIPVLRGLKDLLPPKEQQKLQVIEDALLEQFLLLKKHRIPPNPMLRRFQLQCQKLLSALPECPKNWDSPTVLVGALSSPHQLDICRECRFYHVPAKQIPNDWLPFFYVAIYQSYHMFPDDCGVMLYGRVKSWKPVPRWQIRELPKNSEELYYRMEVDSWKQLEVPIAVKELPVVHLRTNLFLLLHSREIPELAIKTPEHYVYYQALSASLELGEGTVFRHPGGVVRHKGGLFQICRFGRKIAAFCTEDFIQTPNAIFRELMTALDEG